MKAFKEVFKLDTNEYMFVGNTSNEEFTYKHKYLVPDSVDESNEDPDLWLGLEEKWSNWTNLSAREYSKKYNVDIVDTKKKPIKRRKQ